MKQGPCMCQTLPSDFDSTIRLIAYNNPNENFVVNVFQGINVQRTFQSQGT